MPLRRLFSITFLLILAACTQPPVPQSATASASDPPPTFKPTALPTVPVSTSSPTPQPTPHVTLTPMPLPTPPALDSPLPTPEPVLNHTGLDVLLAEPPPRPVDYVVVNPTPPRRVPNATRSFWLTDPATGTHREITARLRAQTSHVAMWVEENVWHDVQVLQQAAGYFETQIYTPTRSVFGFEWTPGVDNDPHIHVLHAADLGGDVLGYVSSGDELPRSIYPHSNEAELIVVGADVEVGSPAYYALLTRHFQRIIQWFQDRNEKRWVKEGLAELAVQLAGLKSIEEAQAYLEQPNTSLTTWHEAETPRHRGAAYLFLTYFHQRFGDEGVRQLMGQSPDGIAGFSAALDTLGAEQTFEEFFGDWLVANYLDDNQGDTASPYAYESLDLARSACVVSYEQYPVTIETSVQQFGADYVSLRGEADLLLRFTGRPTVTLFSALAHSGRYYWWSNRADESMTTLTRAFDFSAIESGQPITMTYWAWRDIEEGYDHVSIEASPDGEVWQRLLPTPDSDSHQWVQEQVDLSRYAGMKVAIRFTYLTDEAITGEGFFIDDVAIPAIGYYDDAESAASGWESQGFIHSNGQIPQRYLILLVGLEDENAGVPTIEHLHLNDQEPNEWLVPLRTSNWAEAILVISGLVPLTPHPAPYEINVVEK